MMSAIEQATRFEDLVAAGESDPAYSFSTIFDERTWRSRGRSKKKLKLLKRMDPKIRSALQEGEKVRYVTHGTGVSFWESYFLGWVMYFLNRRAILITDRRILLLQIDSRMRPSVLASQLRYSAIRKIGRTILGNTKIALGNGKTCVFAYVPKADRKFLQNLVDFTGQRFAQEATGLEELCPHCFAVVNIGDDACGTCGGTFKSAKRATLRSLAFPGLGDWYLGHRKIAVFEMLLASLIWLGVLLPDPEYPFTVIGLIFAAAFVVIFFHGADALATRHIARKGLYPDRAPHGGMPDFSTVEVSPELISRQR
jgi:hypothetical protein